MHERSQNIKRKNIAGRNFMIIALVTEFPQPKYYQWRHNWDEERQLKYNVLVKSVCVEPATLDRFDETRAYWDWIRRADVVFVYCSRIVNKLTWKWYELPLIVKHFMKPEAKMIVQFDDDLVWVFHPDWVWWKDNPLGDKTPEEFFKNGLLDVADMYLSVLHNPPFLKYTTKPVRYLPLPQLWRYDKYPETHNKKRVALMRHSSRTSSINHTIKNIIKPLNLPAVYFSIFWSVSQRQCVEWATANLPAESRVYGWLNKNSYMDILNQSCSFAIDDAENYIGWSRFAMECALTHIPCIGSTPAVKDFFPKLYTEPADYSTQIDLLNQLIKDKAFYTNIVKKATDLLNEKQSNDYLSQLFLSYIRELGYEGTPLSVEDIEKELLLNILKKILPFHILPKRPTDSTVYDHHLKTIIDGERWDKNYKRYERFINDAAIYKQIIKEGLRRRDSHARSVFF